MAFPTPFIDMVKRGLETNIRPDYSNSTLPKNACDDILRAFKKWSEGSRLDTIDGRQIVAKKLEGGQSRWLMSDEIMYDVLDQYHMLVDLNGIVVHGTSDELLKLVLNFYIVLDMEGFKRTVKDYMRSCPTTYLTKASHATMMRQSSANLSAHDQVETSTTRRSVRLNAKKKARDSDDNDDATTKKSKKVIKE